MLAPPSKRKTANILTGRAAAQNAVRGYFAEASKRSGLSNLLSASASPTALKESNEAVKSVTSSRERASREEVTLNSKYASLHGN